MPMLALLLLCAGLFGRDADAGDASLRSQILQADAGHAGVPPAHDQTPEPTALQLYRLRQDRVLRVGNQPLQADAPQRQAGIRDGAFLAQRQGLFHARVSGRSSRS